MPFIASCVPFNVCLIKAGRRPLPSSPGSLADIAMLTCLSLRGPSLCYRQQGTNKANQVLVPASWRCMACLCACLSLLCFLRVGGAFVPQRPHREQRCYHRFCANVYSDYLYDCKYMLWGNSYHRAYIVCSKRWRNTTPHA